MTTPATFKCAFTGNTVTFKEQLDIDSMRKHPEYTEVFEHVGSRVVLPTLEQSLSIEEQPVEVKKMGRPRKVEQ